jgi:hypothetical protein
VKARYKELIERYGLVAVLVYLSTSLAVGVPAFIALKMGLEVDSAAGTGGTAAATFAVLKLTQIPRLAFTAIATPIVGRYVSLPMPGLEPVEVEVDGEAPAADVAPEPEAT